MPRTSYDVTETEVATFSRAIAAALPGEWTLPPDQSHFRAATILRADGLRLFLSYETYGAKVGRLSISASIDTAHPSPGRRIARLVPTGGATAPTFAALGPNGNRAEACAAAIARRVLTADLDAAALAAQSAARALAVDCANWEADCAALTAQFSAVLRVLPDQNDPENRARVMIRAPGLDLIGYAYRDGGTLAKVYIEKGGSIDRAALLQLCAAFQS